MNQSKENTSYEINRRVSKDLVSRASKYLFRKRKIEEEIAKNEGKNQRSTQNTPLQKKETKEKMGHNSIEKKLSQKILENPDKQDPLKNLATNLKKYFDYSKYEKKGRDQLLEKEDEEEEKKINKEIEKKVRLAKHYKNIENILQSNN